MRITKKLEDIEIKTFMRENDGLRVVTSSISVPPGTSDYALAAMFKGLAEHFFDPLGDTEAMNLEMRKDIDTTLSAFKAKVSPSKIIT